MRKSVLSVLIWLVYLFMKKTKNYKENKEKIVLHTHYIVLPPPKMKKVNHKWILASRPPKTFKCWNRKNTLENATTWHHFSEPLQTRALYTTTATLFSKKLVPSTLYGTTRISAKMHFFSQQLQNIQVFNTCVTEEEKRKIGFM